MGKCCDNCRTEYKYRSNKRFCSQICGKRWRNRPSNMTPAQRRRHHLRKKAYNSNRDKQPISRFYLAELINIYANRPPKMEVDHIIPLNGENISGLHVPWNLQYLTPEENVLKSNRIVDDETTNP